MKDISSMAQEVINPWPYIEKVLATEFVAAETDSRDVGSVYINHAGTHQHVLVNTAMDNAYLAIIVDVENKNIPGHHFLNLNKKYGLTH